MEMGASRRKQLEHYWSGRGIYTEVPPHPKKQKQKNKVEQIC